MKIEGKNAVYELLKTDKTIDKLLVENGQRDEATKRILALAKDRGVKVQFADRSALAKENAAGRSQGVLAFTSDFRYTELCDIIASVRAKGEKLFFVVLDGVEDPHNLGAVIRVCECAGVNGLVIGKHRGASVTDTAVRVSEGAANHLPVARVTNIPRAVQELKDAGAWATALELGGEDLYSCDLTGDVALVVGGEDSGVHRLTRETCDRVATIPMRGKVNSLNASVACGVGVFEALRQRIGAK